MSSYILSTAVEFDLDEIWEYIAADNIDAAYARMEQPQPHGSPSNTFLPMVSGLSKLIAASGSA